MTKQEKEEKNVSQLKEQNQLLESQMKVLLDQNNLKDQSYFRQQVLIMLERQAIATERMATALENSSEESEVPEIEPKK